MKATGTLVSAAAMLMVGAASPASALSHRNTIHVPCGDTGALIRAINAANAHGGTLSLAHKCTYHLTSASTDNDGLPPITQKITIKGNDATIQRDTGTFRIFEVDGPPLTGPTGPAGNLTAKELTIKGGQLTALSDKGAGVLVQPGGTLRLIDSTVTGNTSAAQGGGIANFGRTTIVHSTVINNTTTTTIPKQFGSGGGIYSTGALTITKHSRLTSNSSQGGGSGGALFTNGGTIKIDHSTFRSNISSDGGALYVDQGTLDIVDSALTGNTSTGRAGGLENEDHMTMRRTVVEDNTAASDGGGIYTDGDLALDGGRVTGNQAHGRGGGIWNGYLLRVKNSRITANHADKQGGGLWANWDAQVSHTTVSGNTVIGATAQGGGGFWNRGTLALDDVHVTGNRTTDPASQGGGILNFFDSTSFAPDATGNLLLTRTKITGNTAGTGTTGTNAGGVWTNKPLLVFKHSTIRRNHPTNCVASPVRPDSCTN